MGNFKKGGNFGARAGGFRPGGSRPSFGGPRGGSSSHGHDDRPQQMHSATCADCGNTCDVPFRPTGERPVYCRDCFGGHRDNQPTERPRYDAPRNSNFDRREKSFVPAANSQKPDTRIDDLKGQISALHKKVDSLVALIERLAPAKPAFVAPAAEAKHEAMVPAIKQETKATKPAKAAAKPAPVAKKPVSKGKTGKKK